MIDGEFAVFWSSNQADDNDSTNDNYDDPIDVIDIPDDAPSNVYASIDPTRRVLNKNGEYNNGGNKDNDNAPSDIYIAIEPRRPTDHPAFLWKDVVTINVTNISDDTIDVSIQSNSKGFLVCTNACSDTIDVGIHNNNNDTCSDVIDVDSHNNNKGFLFGTFDEVHYGDDGIDKKTNENNNDDSTTVDSNVYITIDACSDAIDVGIHNNNDATCSSAIDVGIYNNNERFYFGTFDKVHYDDNDNNITDPCDACVRDENPSSASIELEEKIDNTNQSSNQENPNCVIVIHSSIVTVIILY